MSEAKHTPTPWESVDGDNGELFIFSNGCEVAEVYTGNVDDDGYAKADRDFIVLACDAHDELLELVRNLADVLAETHKNMPRHHCTIGCCDLGKWEDQARRLVARAANGGRGSPLSAG